MIHQRGKQISEQIDTAQRFRDGHQDVDAADQDQHTPWNEFESSLFMNSTQQHQNQGEGEAHQTHIVLETDNSYHHHQKCHDADDLVASKGGKLLFYITIAVELVAAKHDIKYNGAKEVRKADTEENRSCNIFHAFNSCRQIRNENTGKSDRGCCAAHGTKNRHTAQQNGRCVHLCGKCDSKNDHDGLDRDRAGASSRH